MKKLFFGICSFVLLGNVGLSQPSATPAAPPPPPVYGWKHSLVAGLTLTQVAFTDWAQGGENALAYTVTADGKSEDDEEGSNWTTIYKFVFGQARLGDQGLKKTDDIIDVGTVYTVKLNTLINPYASATFKSQFAKGYKFDNAGNELEVSKFLDPAFLTQTAGFGYQPSKEFKTRLGAGLREVITDQFNQYADDPATPEIEKTSVDGGLESVSNLELQLDDNILLTSQLELFDPFKHLDEVIVRNTTTLTGKVNKYITSILSLQLINEKKISPRTQIKESISLGMSYTLF